ncbi:MAG: hypothetical protein AAFQ98_09615 [Bacteroidota bacterium]
MKETELSFLSFDKRLFFFFICAASILLVYFKDTFIVAETPLMEVLADDGQFGTIRLLNGLSYLALPLLYFLKFTVIALGLFIASFGIGYRLTFKSLWHLAMIGQVSFLFLELVRVVWFMVIPGDPSVADVRNFFPLSILQTTDYLEVMAHRRYALRMLNVFELVYWVWLVYGVHYLARKRLLMTFWIVFLGYILPYLIVLGFTFFGQSS